MMNQRSRLVLMAFFIAVMCASGLARAQQTVASPDRLGVSGGIVEEAIEDEQIPGAVVLLGHDGEVIYRKAFGERALEPRREPMTSDTIFDLASLTKVVAT